MYVNFYKLRMHFETCTCKLFILCVKKNYVSKIYSLANLNKQVHG